MPSKVCAKRHHIQRCVFRLVDVMMKQFTVDNVVIYSPVEVETVMPNRATRTAFRVDFFEPCSKRSDDVSICPPQRLNIS